MPSAALGSPRGVADCPCRWPGKVLRYWTEDAALRKVARSAAGAWNRARVGISFRRARHEYDADVLILRSRRRGCDGTAPVGVQEVPAIVRLGSGCTRSAPYILTHELGHVLGLEGHRKGQCSIMAAGFVSRDDWVVPSGCPRDAATRAYWRANLLAREDVEDARDFVRYGPATAFGRLGGTGLDLQTEPGAWTASGRRITWDFGDGDRVATAASDSPVAAHRYARQGTYTVVLSIRNRFGERFRERYRVTVTESGRPYAELLLD